MGIYKKLETLVAPAINQGLALKIKLFLLLKSFLLPSILEKKSVYITFVFWTKYVIIYLWFA